MHGAGSCWASQVTGKAFDQQNNGSLWRVKVFFFLIYFYFFLIFKNLGNSLGSQVVRTLCFHCSTPKFDP